MILLPQSEEEHNLVHYFIYIVQSQCLDTVFIWFVSHAIVCYCYSGYTHTQAIIIIMTIYGKHLECLVCKLLHRF